MRETSGISFQQTHLMEESLDHNSILPWTNAICVSCEKVLQAALEARNLKSRCWQDWFPLRAVREAAVPDPSPGL